MPLVVSRARLVAIAIVASFQSAASAAVSSDWVAVKVRGTVVQLVGSQWEELAPGGVLPDGQALRTLQSGRLQLQRDDETIALGPNTTVEIEHRGEAAPTLVRQYSGSVVVKATIAGTEHITVETPVIAVSTNSGVVTVAFDDDSASVIVNSGTVTVVDLLYGSTALLTAGQAVTNSASAGLGVSSAGCRNSGLSGSGVKSTNLGFGPKKVFSWAMRADHSRILGFCSGATPPRRR